MILALCGLTACAKPQVQTIPVATQPVSVPAPVLAKKVFRTAAVGQVKSLDPAKIETMSERLLISNLVEPLFQRNAATGEIVPRACEKFEISSDGLKWKITLRNDLFWSNGKKIKARDYEIALRRLLKPKTKSSIAKKLLSIRGAQEMLEGAFYNPDNVGISSVDRLSQSELNITLISQDPFLSQTLIEPATAPIPADTYDIKQELIFDVANWVSSGPFTVTKQSPTSFILQKNRHHRYYSGIKIDEVHFFALASSADGEKMFMSGLLDEFGYPDLILNEKTLTALAGTKYIVFQPDFRTVFLRLNVNQPPFNQFQFRQAIAMSVNQSALLDSIGLEGQKKAESMIPESIRFYNSPHGYYANVEGAKQLLENLGYCEKGDCSMAPRLTLTHPEDLALRKVAWPIMDQLKGTLSLKQANLKSLDAKSFLLAVENGQYMMALDEIAVEPDNIFGLIRAFVSKDPLSGGYSNAEFDQLIEQALQSPLSSNAQKYYREAESLLLRDVAVIPLFFRTTPILLHPRIKGFVPNIWNVHPFESIQIQ